MKKTLWIPLAFWLILIIGSCRTVDSSYLKYEAEDFSAVPQRVEQKKPETIKDLADMIIYYEELVSEWESFGISVYETLEIPLPESLQSIKNYMEKKNEQSPVID